MEEFKEEDLKKLFKPSETSHKGQNGKLMIIGGSQLFHGASLWALKVASRIVDMVFYASTIENNELSQKLKSEVYDFIAIPRNEIENYIEESDAVLIGPGMVRSENSKFKIQNSKLKFKTQNLEEIGKLGDEGEQTFYLTKYLLEKYPYKKWVIDAGALQMMNPEWLKQLNGNVIITPHQQEFDNLEFKIQNSKFKIEIQNSKLEEKAISFAKEYNCTILLKGQTDIICAPERCTEIGGGNEGMTKGGTGDVLAGLVGALACKNNLFLSAAAGSYINKKAGEELYKKVGPYFNASDLADEIPKVMGLINKSSNQQII
ncbi:NAD(P)H-hydrate dehydratase [Candidatus Microgenomates bacterium]|nr:MAG: NAD(P)H-hydrate dehydratase [Candidatus Microgenomates bacterium]